MVDRMCDQCASPFRRSGRGGRDAGRAARPATIQTLSSRGISLMTRGNLEGRKAPGELASSKPISPMRLPSSGHADHALSARDLCGGGRVMTREFALPLPTEGRLCRRAIDANSCRPTGGPGASLLAPARTHGRAASDALAEQLARAKRSKTRRPGYSICAASA